MIASSIAQDWRCSGHDRPPAMGDGPALYHSEREILRGECNYSAAVAAATAHERQVEHDRDVRVSTLVEATLLVCWACRYGMRAITESDVSPLDGEWYFTVKHVGPFWWPRDSAAQCHANSIWRELTKEWHA